jgi:hypothetical protein
VSWWRDLWKRLRARIRRAEIDAYVRQAARERKRRSMGEVRDEVKGPAPKRKAKLKTNQNILDTVTELMDEVSELTAKKDEDVGTEGDAAAPENIRKAGSLRAVHALLSACRNLLENY